MLKRENPWASAGAVALAAFVAIAFTACNRDADVADDYTTDIDVGTERADYDPVVPTTPGTIGTSPGTTGTTPGTSPGTAPRTDGLTGQGGPPPMDGSAIPPSPGDGQVNVGDTLPPPSQAPMDAPMTEGAAGREDSVMVTLSGDDIEMPDTMPAGMTTFNIRNDGDESFTVEIQGQGVDESLESPVEPGQSETLSIDLQPGTYTIRAGDGIEKEITVESAGASPAAQ